MPTLTEFLLARIAEDEAAAERGRSHPDPATFANDNYGYLWVDPARVLAECEAKRRIVDRLTRAIAEDDAETDQEAGWVTRGVRDALTEVAHELALVYADHPDYSAEWVLSPDLR
jgi:hypothetical protein